MGWEVGGELMEMVALCWTLKDGEMDSQREEAMPWKQRHDRTSGQSLASGQAASGCPVPVLITDQLHSPVPWAQ